MARWWCATQKVRQASIGLQNAFDGTAHGVPLEFWLFDLPHFDGHDLRGQPLSSRRALLQQLLTHAPLPSGEADTPLKFSEELSGSAAAAFARACKAGDEGVIAKRRDAPYVSGRSTTWLKLKCRRRQEFVVGGYALRQGSTTEVGSLLLGVFDADGQLQHAGSVGTGWSLATARELLTTLQKRVRQSSPFTRPVAATRARRPRRGAGQEVWVRPELVAEVAFTEWTPAGQVRHATFVGLRRDKPAAQIRREQEVEPPAEGENVETLARSIPTKTTRLRTHVAITHGKRVVDAATGTTKADLVAYFDAVADWLLPELKGRPVSLLRAPQGVGGETFFQKHRQTLRLPGVKELDAALWPGHAPLLQIDTRQGLLAAAQMNVVELHTGNARSATLGTPQRIVFDLDPGEGVGWDAIREGALLVRALLQELGLKCALKTSGGRGLHVVVPIAADRPHDDVKAFAKALVQHLARTVPARFVARSGPANRVGRIFVDYLRNGFDSTTVTAFSPRARPGLGVSMPLDWGQLPRVESSGQWTVSSVVDCLSARTHDPWDWMRRSKQRIDKPAERLRSAA